MSKINTAVAAIKNAATAPQAGPPREPGTPDIKQDMPLVPATSIAGRALVTVIAIMTYLASLSAGAAFLIAGASEGWRNSISREMTIQIRPAAGRDLEADTNKAAEVARAAAGVTDIRIYTKAESEQLLEPWLGSGLDLAELPIPRMIVVGTKSGQAVDAAALKKSLADTVSTANLDDHRQWISRLAAVANTIVMAAVIVFLLVLTAMAMAVIFATRGAMAGTREIVDVLHFVGAEDMFISRQFQRHFLRLGLRGALIGSVSAIATFFGLSLLASWWLTAPGGDQMQTLFGSFGLGFFGYATILAIGVGIAFLTAAISRMIVFRRLAGRE